MKEKQNTNRYRVFIHLKIVYFVSSAERRTLSQDFNARALKYIPNVIRTIFFVRCIATVSRVGLVLRAES